MPKSIACTITSTKNSTVSGADPAGLYIHVPFCRTKCRYCDFYSILSSSRVEDWLKALEKEALLYTGEFSSFDSMYIGGGTPTVLKTAEITLLTDWLARHFHFLEQAERTIEANPNDIGREMLREIKEAGINRISLGVQSLDDRELAFLGRRHRALEAVRAVEESRASGFQNISVDLIYGLPEQTVSGWIKTLTKIAALAPEHISCYQLTLAKDTPLGRLKERGKLTVLSEEDERRFFLTTSQFLESHGYSHYEISSFSKGNRFCCRHNQKYWNRTPYLGLGPSAHSFLKRKRWWNCRSVEQYCQRLGHGQAPRSGEETLTDAQVSLETLSVGLRTKNGIAIEDLKCYSKASGVISDLVCKGYVKVIAGRVVPTLEGFLVADRLPLMFVDE